MTKTMISRSSRLAIATVGALMAPTFAIGQDSTAMRTHTVRKGDTLWGLARAYTNDPLRWKQVYHLNTVTIEDPHWIYPGERLRLPGSPVADATATVPARTVHAERTVAANPPGAPEPRATAHAT